MRKVLLFLFLIFISLHSYGKTKEQIPGFFKCKMPESCLDDLLAKEKMWGNLILNYKKGVALWKIKPIISFQVLGKDGEQKIQEKDNLLTPSISLPQIDDPYELAISLNHEMVHFVNSHESLKYIGDDKKINNCLTRYRLALLKDEAPAFREEIHFWIQSPGWFKKHFRHQKFESRLLERKVSYEEYYKLLKQKMDSDILFIEKRYISLGEYPVCVKELL